MLRLLLEEILLFFTFLFVVFLLLFNDRVDGVDLGLKLNHLLLLLGLPFLELTSLLLQFGLAVLGLELLAHSKGH